MPTLPSRRKFLADLTITSATLAAPRLTASAVEVSQGSHPPSQPNVLMICADQFRSDFIGVNRENPSTRTPHIDVLARRGLNFREAVCNQPLCSPSRASFLTGVNATDAKVWKLGLELDHSLPTVATVLKSQGYTTAFVGKWHVAAVEPVAGAHKGLPKAGVEISNEDPRGLVPAGPPRGGFDDLFEGANVPEIVSHPYQGNYWDTAGNNIGYQDVYRADFITERGVQFLQRKHEKPWLLFVSQLEPHQQNDVDLMVPPKRYEGAYQDAFVPYDLRNLPGNWQSRLPGYYGCVQAIDDCVGRLVDTLEKTGQLDNTLIVFFSDHGCTFRTRIGEYKRSPHDASLRVPLIIAGPGFDRGTIVDEVVSLLDLAPTLIEAAGATVPTNMKGKPLQPLVSNAASRADWDSAAYIQISSSICGRALRTKDWCYAAYDPSVPRGLAEFSRHYIDFALYSLAADPYEQVNLIGREEYRQICSELREELKKRIVSNGEPAAEIDVMPFYA